MRLDEMIQLERFFDAHLLSTRDEAGAPPAAERCPRCADTDGAGPELWSVQVWDGGVRLVY